MLLFIVEKRFEGAGKSILFVSRRGGRFAGVNALELLVRGVEQDGDEGGSICEG